MPRTFIIIHSFACIYTATNWVLIPQLYVVQIETRCYHSCYHLVLIIRDCPGVITRAKNGSALSRNKMPYNRMSVWQLGTVQHCVSGVKRVWFFTDCIIMTLGVNDDDDDSFQVFNHYQDIRRHKLTTEIMSNMLRDMGCWYFVGALVAPPPAADFLGPDPGVPVLPPVLLRSFHAGDGDVRLLLWLDTSPGNMKNILTLKKLIVNISDHHEVTIKKFTLSRVLYWSSQFMSLMM